MRRADLDGVGSVEQLLLMEIMVATQQHQGRFAVEEIDQRLDLAVGFCPTFEFDEVGDGTNSRCRETLRFTGPGVVLNAGDR